MSLPFLHEVYVQYIAIVYKESKYFSCQILIWISIMHSGAIQTIITVHTRVGQLPACFMILNILCHRNQELA